MHKKLILEAFERVKKNEELKGVKNLSKSRIAEILSGYIEEKMEFPIGNRSIRDYYNIALDKNQALNIPQQKVVQGLCNYLGYQDYNEFLKDHNEESAKGSNFRSKYNKTKTTIGSIIIAAFLTYFGYDMTKKDCMVWVDNSRYERIKCEEKTEPKSIPFNKVAFENMKRVEPDCNYPFFKPDGSENLWYGKSAEGELEFFTYYGLHPLTGKTLDPITQYMIDKYICKNE